MGLSNAGAPGLRGPDSRAELEERLRAVLAAEPSVRWAYLFGSAARGGEFRDLDVAVVLTSAARGAVAFGRVVSRLEVAVSPCPVDVVEATAVAPRVAGRIVREGRLLVDRAPDERRSWELEANRRALDIEPWLAEAERLRNESLRRRVG